MIELSRSIRLLMLGFAFLCLGGCAFERLQTRTNTLYEQGRYEEAVTAHKLSLIDEPTNARYRIAYYAMRDKAIAALMSNADQAMKESRTEDAKEAYARILRIDERNTRAREELARLESRARHLGLLARARNEFEHGNSTIALDYIRSILVESPRHPEALALRAKIEMEQDKPRQVTEKKLADAFRAPISIEFRDAQLKQVFEILSRTSGLNFVLDRDVKGDQKTTIFLRNSTVAEALSLTLLTNQLEQRVLNSSSVLIYPNTAAKVKEYEPLSVKSFVLNNGEAKNVANTLKTILKSKDVVVDEKQNLLILRDSPEAIRLAEKLIAVHDMPEPEVMLDVEVLEVKRTKLLELGIQYPSQLSLSPLSTSGGTSVTLYDLLHMNSSSVSASLSSMVVNANNTLSDVNVLANPRIRTRNKEKAKIQVGERLPNVTSTSTSTGFVAESIQYVDVGLKLEVEPAISADGEVAIKINLEVSNVVNKSTTKNGSTTYEIGTRNATTVLRLRDGQNQILAGLINGEERVGTNQIPGLGDLPMLGRLFGSRNDETVKSEIVLSITPHIVRSAPRLDANIAEFESGTESSIHAHLVDGSSSARVSSPKEQGTSTGTSPATVVTSPQTGNQNVQPTDNTKENPARQAASDTSDSRKASNESPQSNAKDDSQASGSARMSLQNISGGTSINGDVVVVLNVSSDEPLTSVPVTLTYDPTVLSVESVEQGNFMSQSGASAVLSQRNDAQQGSTKILVQAGGASGGSGTGALVQIRFKALKSGETSVSLSGPVIAMGTGGKAVEMGSAEACGISIK